VELKCESTWRSNSERCPSRPYLFSEETFLSERCLRAGSRRSVSTCISASKAARAYSSIGQSPRLITGLFLVRTQVGPRVSFPLAPVVALEGVKPLAALSVAATPSFAAASARAALSASAAPRAPSPHPGGTAGLPHHRAGGNLAGKPRCALLLRSVAARALEWVASHLEQQPGIMIRRPTYL
jgi:hypothetical protein